MDVRAAIILVCGVGLGSGAAAGCGDSFAAGAGGGATTSTGAGGKAAASSTSSSASTSSSSSSGAPGTCTRNSPDACGAAAYCSLGDGCDTAANGTCVSVPALSTDESPLCGCDGLTYWNSTVAIGHAVRSTGQCAATGHAVACTAGSCGGPASRAKCDLNVATDLSCVDAGPSSPGACWLLPMMCPGKGEGGFACKGSNNCTSVCSLIEAEAPWVVPVTPCTP